MPDVMMIPVVSPGVALEDIGYIYSSMSETFL
jgi:hypothetical protein